MPGFILNSIKGGFSVLLGNRIAFLPYKLRRSNKIASTFVILGISRNNLIVKERRHSPIKSSKVLNYSRLEK
jgi:hypothetical protein